MYWKSNGACVYALRVPGSHCGRCVLLVALSSTLVSVRTVCHDLGLAVSIAVDSVVAFLCAGKYVTLSGWC